MWGILIALLSGALMSVQGVFNTELTKQTSLWVSTGWVQISAFLVCVAAWLFTGRQLVGALIKVENKYILLSIYHCNSYSKYVLFRTCKSSNAYCNRTACSGIYHWAFGVVWCGKSGFSVEKAFRNGHCCYRDYYF